jgi:ribonuclease HI
VAEGLASLDDCSTVFDAEAIGAWRGFQQATGLSTSNHQTIWVCVDNTAAITGLTGNPPTTSQWAYLAFKEHTKEFLVQIKWCPGHYGIPSNERVDLLANRGRTS